MVQSEMKKNGGYTAGVEKGIKGGKGRRKTIGFPRKGETGKRSGMWRESTMDSSSGGFLGGKRNLVYL